MLEGSLREPPAVFPQLRPMLLLLQKSYASVSNNNSVHYGRFCFFSRFCSETIMWLILPSVKFAALLSVIAYHPYQEKLYRNLLHQVRVNWEENLYLNQFVTWKVWLCGGVLKLDIGASHYYVMAVVHPKHFPTFKGDFCSTTWWERLR